MCVVFISVFGLGGLGPLARMSGDDPRVRGQRLKANMLLLLGMNGHKGLIYFSAFAIVTFQPGCSVSEVRRVRFCERSEFHFVSFKKYVYFYHMKQHNYRAVHILQITHFHNHWLRF